MSTPGDPASSSGPAAWSTVTLDRPERKNAANGTMMRELQAVFDEWPTDRDVRVPGPRPGPAMPSARGPISRTRHDGPAGPGTPSSSRCGPSPTSPCASTASPSPPSPRWVAWPPGPACRLALGCDLVVASTSARFSQIFAKRGLSVDFGARRCAPPHRAPPGQGAGLLRRHPEGRGGPSFGLVNRVVADDRLDAFVDDWARRLAEGPTAGPVDDQDDCSTTRWPSPWTRRWRTRPGPRRPTWPPTTPREALAAFADRRAAAFRGTVRTGGPAG